MDTRVYNVENSNTRFKQNTVINYNNIVSKILVERQQIENTKNMFGCSFFISQLNFNLYYYDHCNFIMYQNI